MRSGTNCTITSGEVYSWARDCLLQAKLVKDHGWHCTAAVVLGSCLRAAARSISVSAACRDLAKAPSDQAVMTALEDGLPKTLPVLERRLNEPWSSHLPRRMRRRAWHVAIDLHLQPYYGQPYKSRNEIYYGAAETGDAAKFHAYASACIVEYGRRYTAGPDLGATPRVDGRRAAALAGANPRNRPENQAVCCWIGDFSTWRWWNSCSRKTCPS